MPFMISRRTLSFLYILIASSCIDRLDFDVELPLGIPLTVDGSITNRPGPYRIKISSGFDTKSEFQQRVPVSLRWIKVMELTQQEEEELVEVSTGTYETRATGIQGRVGGVYQIQFELLDGRVYESLPDTLLEPGTIESAYSNFTVKQDNKGVDDYGFDIGLSSKGNSKEGGRYMWKMKGTFKAITRPELIPTNPPKTQCFPFTVNGAQRCNFLPPCTGLQNTSLPWQVAQFVRVGPCTCCTCWYDIYNNSPLLNNDVLPRSGNYKDIYLGRIPVNEWIFMFKIYVDVSQATITNQTFRFFQSIKDQQDATNNIFQPITGKIPSNFNQLEGTPSPINGLFYAAGVDVRTILLTPEDVPNQNLIPEVDLYSGVDWISCLELFPNSTNIKPAFWED